VRRFTRVTNISYKSPHRRFYLLKYILVLFRFVHFFYIFYIHEFCLLRPSNYFCLKIHKFLFFWSVFFQIDGLCIFPFFVFVVIIKVCVSTKKRCRIDTIDATKIVVHLNACTLRPLIRHQKISLVSIWCDFVMELPFIKEKQLKKRDIFLFHYINTVSIWCDFVMELPYMKEKQLKKEIFFPLSILSYITLYILEVLPIFFLLITMTVLKFLQSLFFFA